MHRVDTPGHVDNAFVAGDPLTGTPATVVGADIMNAFQEELAYVVEQSGITLSKGDNTQLSQALSLLFGDSSALSDNLLINGNFRFWQRRAGAGTFALTAGGGYTADRWRYDPGTTGVATVSREDFAVGQTDVPGAPVHFLEADQTSGGSTAPQLQQRVESVRSGVGQTLTFSVWLKVASGTLAVTPQLRQHFGTGGSADVNTVGASAFTVTTSWQKFTWTQAVPAISGKTISGGDDYLEVLLACPTSATFTLSAARAKLELGLTATAFLSRPIQVELDLCKRYFEKSYPADTLLGTTSEAGAVHTHEPGGATVDSMSTRFSVEKRATPTVVWYSTDTGDSGKVYDVGGATDVTATPTLQSATSTGVVTRGDSPTDPRTYGHFTADAEL